MICGKCSVKVSCSSSEPVLYKQGISVCLNCCKKEGSMRLPPIPIQLQKVQKSKNCSIHKLREMKIYNIDRDQLYCEKCLMFNPQMKEIRKENLIEASQVQIRGRQVQNQIDHYCRKNSSSEKIILNDMKMLVQSKKNQVVAKNKLQIENKYQQIINKLQLAKNLAIQDLQQDAQIIMNSFVQSQNILHYDSFIRNLRKLKQAPLKQKMQSLNQIQSLHQNCVKEVHGILEKYDSLLQKQYFILGLQSENPEEEEIQLQFSISEVDAKDLLNNINYEDEMLLEDLDVFEDFNNISCFTERICLNKFEEDTEMSQNRSMISSIEFSNSKLDNLCVKHSNSVMVINKLEELQRKKIGSSIKEIKANNLNMGITQSKKLLKYIKESFVVKLDLSFNKLNSSFILNLSRREAGKYLKQIKLEGNNLNSNNSCLVKKLKMLEKQGIKIIF